MLKSKMMTKNNKYHIGKVSHVYGEQYGDSGGSQNYCYRKLGFVEDSENHKRYLILNMCRCELPYHCKYGLTRKVYFNLGQRALFRLEESEYNNSIAAHKCGIKWNYEKNSCAIIIDVIDSKDNLIIPTEIKENSQHERDKNTIYTEYTKIKLDKFLENPNEDFLLFYGDG